MEKLMRFLCSTIFSIIVALGIPQMARAAEVAINETNFPDAIFRDYVTSEFDKDSNGKLSEEEIAEVTGIYVIEKGITSLTGIEYFTNLIDLWCNSNQLTELNVSKNTALTQLLCDSNQLIELDVSKNISLKTLHCNSNQLKKLDVSKNIALTELLCDFNYLVELDVSNNISLIDLWCNSNQLKKLDVSKNTSLIGLLCYDNQITELDVSKNTDLVHLECYNNQLMKLDISKSTVLTGLSCHNNQLTELKLNSKIYHTLTLCKLYLHDYASLSNLKNITETETNDYRISLLKVTDINKPATYQYEYKGKKIDFTILYVNTENKTNNSIISYCGRLFNDYEYKEPVSGTAITLYGNCRKNTDTIKKDMILYTDILASYNYSVNNKGKVKASTGKVIVGITMSDTKPTITKNKIVDNEAAKIAKAKIKNGQITITATGKAGGVVYLWIMDTGNKGVSECCPINVKLAPKKLEVQETTGSKANKLKIVNGTSKEVKIAGFVGTTKTEDCTYTATIASNSQSYVSVTTLDNKNFTLKGTGLKNDKDTKVSITFTCKENGKKIKFTATITKPTT